jgi:type II secretory pathway component PulF
MLPVGILLLAGFIAPLPQLVAGKTGTVDYLISGLGFALLVLGIMTLILKIPLWIRRASIATNQLSAIVDEILLALPVIKHWYIRKTVSHWLELASLMFASGLSLHATIPLLNKTVSSKRIRESFESVNHALHQGQTLFDAIRHVPYLASETKHFINSGEAAGRLEQMLKHSAELEKARLLADEQHMLEWVPRIVYFFVLSWLASSIISS